MTLRTDQEQAIARFDMVVAADGIHSATRDLVLGPDEMQRFDTGWVAWVESDSAERDLYAETWGTRVLRRPLPGFVAALGCSWTAPATAPTPGSAHTCPTCENVCTRSTRIQPVRWPPSGRPMARTGGGSPTPGAAGGHSTGSCSLVTPRQDSCPRPALGGDGDGISNGTSCQPGSGAVDVPRTLIEYERQQRPNYRRT